jgi:hypothetical protein
MSGIEESHLGDPDLAPTGPRGTHDPAAPAD